jgi:hypothetical protein
MVHAVQLNGNCRHMAGVGCGVIRTLVRRAT